MLVNMSCGWGIFFLSRCDWCRSPVRPDESPWPSGGINHGAHTPSLECREQVAAGVNYYSRLAHFGFWTERGNFPCVLSTSFFSKSESSRDFNEFLFRKTRVISVCHYWPCHYCYYPLLEAEETDALHASLRDDGWLKWRLTCSHVVISSGGVFTGRSSARTVHKMSGSIDFSDCQRKSDGTADDLHRTSRVWEFPSNFIFYNFCLKRCDISTNHFLTSASLEQFTGFSPRSVRLLNDKTQLCAGL